MHIIFLKFGPHRPQAGQRMDAHAQWIQQGIDDGVFLMAGSLDNAQGGAVLAMNMDSAQVKHRVELDPFVVHGIVTPEIYAVSPSRMAQGMAAVLSGTHSPLLAQ
ncbi:MAG TPA: hypothetical protein VFY73_08090 [Ideonella sp.]|uniref:YciI family protein n=1 Tax=Ideonella sp. TaxID=1929293 RepID=UPI002E30424F|nr:hypothetical protein [Ideonella sp.]HEX5683981.1 hypothetical protein [Ideonella sp.]